MRARHGRRLTSYEFDGVQTDSMRFPGTSGAIATMSGTSAGTSPPFSELLSR